MERVLAITWLRYRLLINRLRRREGIWSLVGTVLLGLLWALASVGAAVGVGTVMIQAARAGDESLLFKLQVGVFLVATLAGVMLPLLVEKGQSGPVTARLLSFPVTPNQLFWMSQAALAGSADHLFYYPVLIVVGAAVWLGPGPAWLGLVLVASLWLTILAWGQAVSLGTEVLLRGRRSREVLAVIVVILILLMGMGPGVVERYMGERSLSQLPVLQHVVHGLLAVGRTTAPYQAAAGLQAVRAGNDGAALAHAAGVWIWIGAGLVISRRVFRKFFLGSRGRIRPGRGQVPRASATRQAVRPVPEWWLPCGPLPPVVAANAFKDLRIHLRSLAGRLILVLAPLLMGFIGWSVLKDITQAYLGLQATQLRFFGMLVYVSLTANSQSINNMAFEGSGVQGYFYLPARLEQVLLGKNLGLWLYQLLVLAICLAVLAVVGTLPGPATLLAGILLYGAFIVFRTLTGNVMSCLFPSPRRMSARRENASGMSNLLALVFPLVYLPVVWLFAAVPLLLGQPGLQPVFMALLLVLTLIAELVSLRPVAGLMSDRRERIIAALRAKED